MVRQHEAERVRMEARQAEEAAALAEELGYPELVRTWRVKAATLHERLISLG